MASQNNSVFGPGMPQYEQPFSPFMASYLQSGNRFNQPGWGTASKVGAGLGAAAGLAALLNGTWGAGGSPEQVTQVPRFNSQQMGMLNNLLGLVNNQAQNYKAASFEPIRQGVMNDFNQNIMPSIMERFGNMRSGSFQRALAGAGSDLSSKLGALESNFNLQNQGLQNQFMANVGQLGMTPTFDSVLRPKQPGFGENATIGIMQLLPLIGMMAGTAMGGPIGGAGGQGIGSLLAQLSR